MAISVAQLAIKLSADTKQAETQLGTFAKALGTGGPLTLAGGAAIAAVAAVGIASVKMAGDFQAGMTSLVTGAGESQGNIKMVSDGILKMATDTGTSTKQLTDGMYMIESAGYHGKAGLDVLRAAAEGAKVGNADLGTVADATTTILNDYPNTVNGAAGAVNSLIATVASGKTHMADLSGALANVLPTASAARVGLNDVMGAMATMTSSGVPAADAATYLRQTILALTAPGKQAQKALADVGLSSSDVATEMQKSLPGALQMITDAVGKKFPVGSAGYVAALKDIAGGSKQMQGILDLTGSHAKTFGADVAGIAGQVQKGGHSIQGWADVQQDFNFKMDRAKEVVETLMIRIGTALLPVVSKMADFFTTRVAPAVGFVSDHFQAFLPILLPVAGAIGGVLVAALVAAAIAAWGLVAPILVAAAPFIAVGAAVGLVTAAVILVLTHWQQIAGFLHNVWDAEVAQVGTAFSALGSLAGAVWGGIQSAIKGAINGGIQDINDFIGFIDSIQIHIPSIGIGPVQTPSFDWNGLGIPEIPYLASGGDILTGGLAVVGERGPEVVGLPAGARVSPNGGGGQMVQVTTQINLDGRRMAEVVTKHQPSVIRQATGARAF